MNDSLAERLRHAAHGHRTHDGDTTQALNLQDLLALHGESSLAVVLVVLAFLCVLPITGVGTVMSFGIWAVAWSWLRHQDQVTLPKRLGRLTLNARWSMRSLHGLAWLYAQSQRWLRPRWSVGCHENTRVGWSAWIALMGMVIFLPLPLGNVLPSLSLVLLGLGWMFRDGVALLLSVVIGLVSIAYAVMFGLWVGLQVMQFMGPSLAPG